MRIPTPEHASLNLAQAVLLIAHQLFEEARSRGLRADGRTLGGRKGPRTTRSLTRSDRRSALADLPTLEPAVAALVELMEPEKLRLSARQAFQEAGLRVRHVELVRGMLSRLDWALAHPELDWMRGRRRSEAEDQGQDDSTDRP